MLKIINQAAIASTILILSSISAFALGAGASFTAGSGETRWYRHDITQTARGNYDYESTSNLGGAVTIDTEKPGEIYFNRFTIGLDRYSLLTNYTQRLSQFNFSTIFGFILVKKSFFKLWLGPQVGIHYTFGNTRYNIYDHNPLTAVLLEMPVLANFFTRAKYNIGGIDAGLVLGFDFDIKQFATISVSFGAKYGAAMGSIESVYEGLFNRSHMVYNHGFNRFVNVGIMHRFDDSSAQKKDDVKS